LDLDWIYFFKSLVVFVPYIRLIFIKKFKACLIFETKIYATITILDTHNLCRKFYENDLGSRMPMMPVLSHVFHLLPFLSRNVSLRSRKRMDLVTIMRGRSSPVAGLYDERRNRRYFFFSPFSKAGLDRLGAGRGRRRGRRGRII